MRRHWQEMEGLTTPEACHILEDLAACVPAEQAIVEVGVYRGRSLAALAKGAEVGNRSEVHGIDPFNLSRPSKPKYSSDETYDVARKNLEGYDVQLHRAFGLDVARRWNERPKVGLLYIDSDHRHGPVLADFAAWAPHLALGAIVCWDDHHESFPGVITAVAKLVQLGRVSAPTMLTDRLAMGRFIQ